MIHQTKSGKEIYTVYSLWDTFRALHPLLTIIKPDLNEKLVMSLMQKYHEGGILPMWELAGNYTATMIGYHAIPVIVDAYMKGFDKIDGKNCSKPVSAARYMIRPVLSHRAEWSTGWFPFLNTTKIK